MLVQAHSGLTSLAHNARHAERVQAALTARGLFEPSADWFAALYVGSLIRTLPPMATRNSVYSSGVSAVI